MDTQKAQEHLDIFFAVLTETKDRYDPSFVNAKRALSHFSTNAGQHMHLLNLLADRILDWHLNYQDASREADTAMHESAEEVEGWVAGDIAALEEPQWFYVISLGSLVKCIRTYGDTKDNASLLAFAEILISACKSQPNRLSVAIVQTTVQFAKTIDGLQLDVMLRLETERNKTEEAEAEIAQLKRQLEDRDARIAVRDQEIADKDAMIEELTRKLEITAAKDSYFTHCTSPCLSTRSLSDIDDSLSTASPSLVAPPATQAMPNDGNTTVDTGAEERTEISKHLLERPNRISP